MLKELFPRHGEVAALLRSRDWSSTPLGDPSSWPASLHTVLRLMLTSRYAMWLGWGPELVFLYNDAYREQTLGEKHPWALGRPAREVWAEIWDAVGPRIEHVISTGEATWDSGLLLFLERNGYPEETYHTFSYSPAYDENGKIRGLFCVVIEETERVIGERKSLLQRDFGAMLGRSNSAAEVLAAVEACLQQEARPIPFSLTYLFDADGKTARRAARSGIAADHPAAPEVVELAYGDPFWQLAEIWAHGRSVEIELPRTVTWPVAPWKLPPQRAYVVPIAQAGQVHPAGAFVAGLNPHRPFHGGYRSFIELFVTQLAASLDNARAYEVEKGRAEALAQIDRAKTVFFSNVSHEFRTPLTLMLGPTEDALASPERALTGEALEIVHRNELRLLKLVNALLDFSRIEAGRAEAHYEATDLAHLTVDLASAFRSAMVRGGLDFQIDCAPLSEPIYVDRDMWEKIVLNLLSNALKFTLRGFVRITLRERDDVVELRVEDSGPGIPPHELPRMFDRFHRIEGTPARTHEGSGIGLALVRDLVELHRGTVVVQSVYGSGTTFTVTLRKGAAHLPTDKVRAEELPLRQGRAESYVSEALRWLPGPATAIPSATTPSPTAPVASVVSSDRVLVADDNADMRDYLARLLRKHWHVDTAPDGRSALEKIRAAPPDVVVSDVMMPHIDGFALLQHLRSEPATRTLPVILLSARAGEEAIHEGLYAGANDYVTKPFSARELVSRVASQLTIAKIRREAEAQKEAERKVVESLFMHAPAAIALVRGDAYVLEFANPMALAIWGKDRSVVGKPLFEALPELRGGGFDELLVGVMSTGVPYVGEEVPIVFRRGGRDASTIVKFVYVPTENSRGERDGVAAFGFDVTTQVLARQKATLAAEVGRVLIADQDLTTQLRQCCDALVAFGAPQAQLWTYNPAHAALERRAHAGAALPVDAPDRVLLGEGRLGRIAQRRQPEFSDGPAHADGVSLTIPAEGSFAGYPLTVGDHLVGVLALALSESISPALHDSLAFVSGQIALGIERDNGERFRELFIGMLGHDLRNPLNAVNMAIHMLSEGALDDQQQRTLRRLQNSAHRMRRMVDQVLDFTRARSGGGIPIARKPADIHEICQHAVEEIASVHPERAIEAEYRGEGRGTWDTDRLAQVFSNLIGNAVTYGSADAPVRILVDARHLDVECRVANRGTPIPEAVLPSLFDPFRRATQDKSSGTQGLGLGLFIAQQIILAHGGTIGVRSTASEGTEFQFIIPRAAEVAS